MSPLLHEKQTVFVANDKIWGFKQKLEFWKICIHYHELDSAPTLKDFSDEIDDDDINECDFWILYNEMCQHLEHTHLTWGIRSF